MYKCMESYVFIILTLIILFFPCSAICYENFKVAIYCPAQVVSRMAEPNWLGPCWDKISSQVNVDKVYLETHRDIVLVDEETIEFARKFFESQGIEVAFLELHVLDAGRGGVVSCLPDGRRGKVNADQLVHVRSQQQLRFADAAAEAEHSR